MKKLLVPFFVAAALSVGATATQPAPSAPDNVCEYAFEHQLTMWNGGVPVFHCYAMQKRDGCDKARGLRCPNAPMSKQQQCSFPAEKARKRCVGGGS